MALYQTKENMLFYFNDKKELVIDFEGQEFKPKQSNVPTDREYFKWKDEGASIPICVENFVCDLNDDSVPIIITKAQQP